MSVDAINVVTDFGADPTNTSDSASNIQAAFDAAFGSATGTPHGTNSTLNRPVFFPNGQYKCNSTLNLKYIVGGNIYGAGPGATQINGPSGGNPVIAIDGAVGLVMERLALVSGVRTSGNIAIDLNWDGTGGAGIGLHNNMFRSMFINTNEIGVRIAHGGNEGYGNLFEHVFFSNNTYGIVADSSTALNNTSIGGGIDTMGAIGYWSKTGVIHVLEGSIGNNVTGTIYAAQNDSGFPVMIEGMRFESNDTLHGNFLNLTHGTFLVKAVTQESAIEFANITGGRLIMDGCTVDVGAGSIGAINGPLITATGTISGTTLTVSGVSGGSISRGMLVFGSGIPTANAPVVISGSGTTWTLNYAPGNVGPISVEMYGAVYQRGCFNFSFSGYAPAPSAPSVTGRLKQNI